MSAVTIYAEQLEAYLSERYAQPVYIHKLQLLGGEQSGAAALKGFGYGKPLRIMYHTDNSQATHEMVLRRVNHNEFGHETDADCVAEVWRDYQTFNRLPRHTHAIDLVGLGRNGRLQRVGDIQELFILTDYVPGTPYAEDLYAIMHSGQTAALDFDRAKATAVYLADIHRLKRDEPALWRRRLRDLVGDGEGIFGLTDSYPAEHPYITADMLYEFEDLANRWRWRLKDYAHRLCQVHGDYHPFNILFDGGINLSLIDRSRGEWGAPEDDVSCLSVNYIFFSIQRDGRLTGEFEKLYHHFLENYLMRTGDEELLEVIAPWYAWRSLVLASPRWYPSLTTLQREKILNFGRNVMLDDSFAWDAVNQYL